MRAALAASAHGAFLSGAGPTVLALCSGAIGDVFAQRVEERQEEAVAAAMRACLAALPDDARHAPWKVGSFYITGATGRGAHVVAAEPPFSSGLATFGSLDGEL